MPSAYLFFFFKRLNSFLECCKFFSVALLITFTDIRGYHFASACCVCRKAVEEFLRASDTPRALSAMLQVLKFAIKAIPAKILASCRRKTSMYPFTDRREGIFRTSQARGRLFWFIPSWHCMNKILRDVLHVYVYRYKTIFNIYI